jgi:uncharacterized protein HemX
MFFSRLSHNTLTLLIIIALAIALGSCIFVIFSYQQQQAALKAVHDVRMEVREKLIIDSILSQYEYKHRERMDSIMHSYDDHIDSLSKVLHHLKKESDVIQAELVSADSLLPVY